MEGTNFLKDCEVATLAELGVDLRRFEFCTYTSRLIFWWAYTLPLSAVGLGVGFRVCWLR